MDPFGLGPALSTFAAVLKKEPFLAKHFRLLMETQPSKEPKGEGLKLFVGHW